jgi:hypothetical protein
LIKYECIYILIALWYVREYVDLICMLSQGYITK